MHYPKPYKPSGQRNYSFFYRDADGTRRMKSTHFERRGDADDYIREFIDKRTSRSGNMTFKQYQAPFFTEACPHVARKRDKRETIGLTHITKSRQVLDRWILTDKEFCARLMNRITPGDLLDLRNRLKARVPVESKRIRGEGLNTINKAMIAIQTILHEAYLRRDIPSNPAEELGVILYDPEQPGILTLAELAQLFAESWADPAAQRVFRWAAITGMRCGEILALHGRQRDGHVLVINNALKGKQGEGLPKWGKTREIMLCAEAQELMEKTDGHAFARVDGSFYSETWWRKTFAAGLKERGIEARGRRLTPHCLRHSLNTHLLEAGVDPLRIQLYLWGVRADDSQGKILDPSRRGITRVQGIYTHFQARMTEPVARKIEELYGAGKKQAKLKEA